MYLVRDLRGFPMNKAILTVQTLLYLLQWPGTLLFRGSLQPHSSLGALPRGREFMWELSSNGGWKVNNAMQPDRQALLATQREAFDQIMPAGLTLLGSKLVC